MMNRSLRTVCSLICAASAAATTGCALTLDDNSITAETLVRYEGTDEIVHVEYLPTQSVRIVSDNGDVEVSTGSVSDVVVTFSPFTMRKKDEDKLAVKEIEDHLGLTAITDRASGDVVISTTQQAGASGYLGADIHVILPADFDGGLRVEQDNGGVEVNLDGAPSRGTTIVSDNGRIEVVGARGAIDVTTDNGSVSVDLDAWSGSDGIISTGNGDIDLTVPAGVDGTMTAHAVNGVVVEQSLPSTWATAGDGGAKSYTMGDGDGGQLDLFTDLGDITIVPK
ncbi:hypothetical protein SOCEGT47_002960 [Sorangium cellulosum]|jgi:DUF4097 and DUF4098 domain-containing protein YvlB|uniref:Adhesin domain-containing protein n=1 Tax=Sorangium cellulosum TaxID=56 RepID=A0A4P2PTZ2_SORCE|nr:hypothetical protein [Sorangium cellulosum]AUX19843.1 hypothetical protein SOCEGT47_002960 [Sorangium cellulosum]